MEGELSLLGGETLGCRIDEGLFGRQHLEILRDLIL